MRVLGLDIGSNSVGSAWVDAEKRVVQLAVSVFPAGVEEQEDKRGAPKNQVRRKTRSQRRSIDRRARRKRLLTRFLMEKGFLPREAGELRKLYDVDPWVLRRRAIREVLTPHQFGRVVIHLAQRRGAVGVVTDPDEPDEGKVKEGMDRLAKEMEKRGARTVGEFIAELIDERKRPLERAGDSAVSRRTRQERRRQERRWKCAGGEATAPVWREPVRNRQYRIDEERQFFAGRELVRKEFHEIVGVQRGFAGSPLASLLTDEALLRLDDPDRVMYDQDRSRNDEQRRRYKAHFAYGGLLFGQRRTYWDTGTLGRCVLEPTERCAPIADRHASYFRVVETVNNIRIERRGENPKPLTEAQRLAVLSVLRGPLFKKSKGKLEPKASARVTDIKKALEINPRDPDVRLNLDADEERDINADWFHREVVHGAFGTTAWEGMTEEKRESVNRAILKFDPDQAEDAAKLRVGAERWWGLGEEAAGRLVEAWKKRPKLEKRLNLSRRAILALLPYMERFDNANNRWPTQQEARKAHAVVLMKRFGESGECADESAAKRYATGAPGLSSSDRYYMKLRKHQIAEGLPEPPPAPMLSNPVVRKAIHEVRRHLMAYLRKFRCKPERVVIEMARITKQSEKQRNLSLARNRHREKIRKAIIEEVLPMAFGGDEAARLTLNQQRSAVDRVVLARQQRQVCPYCGNGGLTEKVAGKGDDMEIDHIVPYSRCGDNGMNNKVLVHRTCNRGKGNLTPREWWRGAFDEKVKFAEKLFKGAEPGTEDSFTRRDYARKWENFNREVREEEEWKHSQLTDTAYASRQVAAYVADALFEGRGLPERGDGEDKQRIFFTVGRFTSMLRKDWQLFETVKPERKERGMSAEEELRLAEKDRGDHRQHAIDAVAIALTEPAIKNRLASEAARAAEYHEKHGKWPKRMPVEPPWGTVEQFRREVLSKVYEGLGGCEVLRVSHRAVKRRLTGAFHKGTHYGPVVGPLPGHRTEKAKTLFTNRISADRLSANHLRVAEGWDEWSAKAEKSGAEGWNARRKLAAMKDPPPGKSGIVRDRALRDRIRKCLRMCGVDPDQLTRDQIKQVVKEGKLTMKSGVAIKGVVLLRTNTEPIVIARKRWDRAEGKMVFDSDPRMARVYIGGNNHHVEIRENHRNGKWKGKIVPTFFAAKRVRREGGSAVDRTSTDVAKYVMSLAEGEMVYARRNDRDPGASDGVGYFVVCKLDKSSRIHFAPHWDGRKAREQDRWDVTPAEFKNCGAEAGKPPVKVRVGALGEVTELVGD